MRVRLLIFRCMFDRRVSLVLITAENAYGAVVRSRTSAALIRGLGRLSDRAPRWLSG
jgi:hypothetical protein